MIMNGAFSPKPYWCSQTMANICIRNGNFIVWEHRHSQSDVVQNRSTGNVTWLHTGACKYNLSALGTCFEWEGVNDVLVIRCEAKIAKVRLEIFKCTESSAYLKLT